MYNLALTTSFQCFNLTTLTTIYSILWRLDHTYNPYKCLRAPTAVNIKPGTINLVLLGTKGKGGWRLPVIFSAGLVSHTQLRKGM